MAKPKDKQPWFKFYPQDWRGDAKLRMCSIGARGLWAEMLCVMHEADPYGYLLSNSNTVTSRQMAALAGIAQGECMKYLLELASAGVYSIDENKVIYSRRMVRDKAKAEQAKQWGKGGGNPELTGQDKGGVNPPDNGKDKPQKPKPNSTSKATSAAEAVALDEGQEKQALTLRVMLGAIRSGRKWAVPVLDQIDVWIAAGIAPNTISTACTPLLNRKEDMASLVYCDSAVRAAHAAIPHLQAVTSKEFVVEGTMEWACWDRYLRETTGRGSAVTDANHNNGFRRGWWHPTKVPPGYDEANRRTYRAISGGRGLIEFTYRKVTGGHAFEAGCRGTISTSGTLTAAQLDHLRAFWESKRNTIRNGEKFELPENTA